MSEEIGTIKRGEPLFVEYAASLPNTCIVGSLDMSTGKSCRGQGKTGSEGRGQEEGRKSRKYREGEEFKDKLGKVCIVYDSSGVFVRNL